MKVNLSIAKTSSVRIVPGCDANSQNQTAESCIASGNVFVVCLKKSRAHLFYSSYRLTVTTHRGGKTPHGARLVTAYSLYSG